MGDLTDPRVLGRSSHKLIDIMVIGVIAIICHAESWYEMEEFGRSKEEWFKKFLELPNGIPSHDTFDRIFGLIDPKEFELLFMKWVEEVRQKVAGDTICIDGKVSKGTMKRSLGQARDVLTTVSAFSTISGVVLGQIKANGSGSSEVSAAKELINLIDVKGMTIVGDAGIGRESLVRKIREKKGNYLFPVKGNTNGFFAKVEGLFKNIAVKKTRSKFFEEYICKEHGHGREETRTVTIIKKKNFPIGLNLNQDGTDRFQDLFIVGRVVYESIEKETRPFISSSIQSHESSLHIDRRDKTQASEKRIKTDTRFFITNIDGDAKFLSEKLRLQWAIENQLHWILDVSMGEDANRTRNKVAAQNLATIRKIAINLVKQESSKLAIKTRLKKAGWDTDYLEQILFKTKLG